MKNRSEVVKYIENMKKTKTELCGHKINDSGSYGLVEFRDALDFIYGGPPRNDDEKLKNMGL